MSKNKKETGFYMIYLEGCSNPTYKHDTFHAAEIEAKRLSSTHDRKAYILKTYRSIEVKKEYDIFKMGKPDEDALPF